MAITFSSVSLQDKSSILRPIGAEFAAFGTAAANMTGKVIYVDLGMFIESGTTEYPITVVPDKGYKIAFPASGTVTMSKLNNPNGYFWENGNVKLTKGSNTTLTISIEALMTMDLEQMLGSVAIDTVQRITKSSKANPSRLNNNSASVFTKTKALRFLVVVAETDDTVIEYGYLDVPFTSRWFEKGLNNGVAEFTGFDYQFRNLTTFGTPPGFSLNQNNTLRFYTTGTWTGGGCFLIWRDTDNPNAAEYMTDTKLSCTFFDNGGTLSQVYDFDNSAFVSCGAVTTIAGSSKYVDIVIDKDYFVKDDICRIAFLPFKTNDYSNSFVTSQLIVTDFITPTTGTITDTIENYSEEPNPFARCSTGAAIRERLRFTVWMDKESYNDAIIINTSNGTFDDNYMEVKMYISDTAIPDGNSFNVNDGELLTNVGYINNSTEAGIQSTITMRPEWAGTIKYITTVFRFKIPVSGVDNTGIFTIDEVYYQQSFQVPAYLTTDDDIEVLGIIDLLTNESITKICGDTGIIQILFKNNTEYNYGLLGFLSAEHDTYQDGANAFVKVNNAVGIFNMYRNFLEQTYEAELIKLAIVNIDTSLLPYGVASCFELIGINQDHIEGACPTSGSLSVSLIAVGGLSTQVTFTGLDVTPAQVEMRLHPITDKPILGNVDKEFIFTETSGDTGVFLGYGHDIWKKYNINIVVKTENNCYLSGNANFQVSKLISATDTQTITLS